MSMNLFLEATSEEPVFFDDDMNPVKKMECSLWQTPTSISYAAVAEDADPYQVYEDWVLSLIDPNPNPNYREWALEHLEQVRAFLELAREKGATIEWYYM